MDLPDMVRHDGRHIAAGHTAQVFGIDDNAASRARRGPSGFCCPEQSRVCGADHFVDPRADGRLCEGAVGRLWRSGPHSACTVNVVAPGVIRPHATNNRWHRAPTIDCARRIFDTRVVEALIAAISRLPFIADADKRNQDLNPRRVKN